MAEEQYAHFWVVIFTVAFKVAALVFYLFCWILIQHFVIQFVVTVFLLALDFWTVKNVSGRILVGLRWWNEVNEQGESVWHFESLDQQTLETLNKKDAWAFWWSLYITPVFWVALGLVAILKFNFDYLLVVSIALVLNGANIVGYTKCRKDAKKQIQQFATSSLASSMGSRIQSAFLSSV